MGLEEFKKMTDQPSVEIQASTDSILKDYDFKVAIVVNTASECGFTRQYKELQELYEKFKDAGLMIFAQPSNQFGYQEPGSDIEIKNFCESNYNVSFTILPKADVIGDDSTDLYKTLTGLTGQSPKWNFHKYVISRKLGSIFSRSHFQEIDEQFVNEIENLLN